MEALGEGLIAPLSELQEMLRDTSLVDAVDARHEIGGRGEVERKEKPTFGFIRSEGGPELVEQEVIGVLDPGDLAREGDGASVDVPS